MFPPVRKEYSLAASFSYDGGDGYNWIIADVFRRSSKSKRASTMLDAIYHARDDDPPGTPAGTFSHEYNKDEWELARACAQSIVAPFTILHCLLRLQGADADDRSVSSSCISPTLVIVSFVSLFGILSNPSFLWVSLSHLSAPLQYDSPHLRFPFTAHHMAHLSPTLKQSPPFSSISPIFYLNRDDFFRGRKRSLPTIVF